MHRSPPRRLLTINSLCHASRYWILVQEAASFRAKNLCGENDAFRMPLYLLNNFQTLTTSKLKCSSKPYQWNKWTHNTGKERPGKLKIHILMEKCKFRRMQMTLEEILSQVVMEANAIFREKLLQWAYANVFSQMFIIYECMRNSKWFRKNY